MQNNKLHYHFSQFLNEYKTQISEEVATSVIQVLGKRIELNKGQSHDEVFLNSTEAASLFKISKSQINKLRKKHSNFPVIKIGAAVRFKQSALELFFNELSNKKQ